MCDKIKLYMKIRIQYILLSALFFISCEGGLWKQEAPKQTAIFYLPWTSDLYSHFVRGIEDVKQSIKYNQIKNARIVVCMARNAAETDLYELKYKKGNCVMEYIKEYKNHDFTTKEGLKTLFTDIKQAVPTAQYSLTISAHGMGWLPIEKKETRSKSQQGQKLHFEYENQEAITRYFGGTTAIYQTEISTLATAIKESGMFFEFIAFDDCYMSNIEVAYELKDVTKHIIASPTEIMAYGFPYITMTPHLVGQINYELLCKEFNKFYSDYEYPYATLGIINCEYIDSIVPIVKAINKLNNEQKNVENIQRMDGYAPTIFFDFGSYISKICTNAELESRFNKNLKKLVPYKTHTAEFPSAANGYLELIPISEFSGITTSDPSENYRTRETKLETPWYKATH